MKRESVKRAMAWLCLAASIVFFVLMWRNGHLVGRLTAWYATDTELQLGGTLVRIRGPWIASTITPTHYTFFTYAKSPPEITLVGYSPQRTSPFSLSLGPKDSGKAIELRVGEVEYYRFEFAYVDEKPVSVFLGQSAEEEVIMIDGRDATWRLGVSCPNGYSRELLDFVQNVIIGFKRLDDARVVERVEYSSDSEGAYRNASTGRGRLLSSGLPGIVWVTPEVDFAGIWP